MDTAKEPKVPLIGIIRNVYKKMGQAIGQYHMLNDGDRVLIGVSGGVDSLSLVKLFQMRKRRIPIDFKLLACFVDTSFIETNKDSIEGYVKSCGIEYIPRELHISKDEANCFWCSWNRRKTLFDTAKEYKCNKVALGHNLDDIVESILMNMFFLGEISAMKPKIDLFSGELSIIRPLCNLEKREILEFAENFNFPVNNYQCVYGKDSRRQFIRDMLPNMSKNTTQIKKNVFHALSRIKKDYLI